MRSDFGLLDFIPGPKRAPSNGWWPPALRGGHGRVWRQDHLLVQLCTAQWEDRLTGPTRPDFSSCISCPRFSTIRAHAGPFEQSRGANRQRLFGNGRDDQILSTMQGLLDSWVGPEA